MLKLYLDENVPESIAEGLQLRGYDVLSTAAAGNKGNTDEEQLLFAQSRSRVLFTFNIKDFAKLHSDYIASGLNHKGIILSRQMPVGKIIRGLAHILATKTPREMENSIVWLNQFV